MKRMRFGARFGRNTPCVLDSAGQKPSKFLSPGDVVRLDIQGLGIQGLVRNARPSLHSQRPQHEHL